MPDPPPDAETALHCDELSELVPDLGRLARVESRDVENWEQVVTLKDARTSRTARWSSSVLLAIEVRPDGSVARACVAEGSDLAERDRGWLDAIRIARFRPGSFGEGGGWLQFQGG